MGRDSGRDSGQERASTPQQPPGGTPLEPLIFERSHPGRVGYRLDPLDVPEQPLGELLPARFQRRRAPRLPEVTEATAVRHYTRLSVLNHHVDRDIYPLGSCTMKYNPKANDAAAALPGFAGLHPLAPEAAVQGALALMHALSRCLAEITGLDRVSLQPAAGAQGELTGMLLARAYFADRGEQRTRVIFPDSAHGTNPASLRLAGFEPVEIRSNARGLVDLEVLGSELDDRTAAFMLTNPNTLGLFEPEILEIARRVHEAGALLYLDGANMNALVGVARPGDMGFDICHLNLHKTFSTPHGGGGPGSGPVGVRDMLEPYLPRPTIARHDDGRFALDWERPRSIGKMHSFVGNFGVLVRAYAYILSLGPEGLRENTENAVVNANYLKSRLVGAYELPYTSASLHEFVLSGSRQKAAGVRTLDIAKRLLDYGFYAPTVYFPLIVDEAIMIEPTESETVRSLDRFAEAMLEIARDVHERPELILEAPHVTPVARLDEAHAARHLRLRWTPSAGDGSATPSAAQRPTHVSEPPRPAPHRAGDGPGRA
jgi:glycine dehydrogenase subunit 2